jgi:sarcosine oxidase
MHKSFDVIVVGVGSMGAATCEQLASRGARVLGLERFGIPHRRGSHHGASRLIRQAYFEHPDYVALLLRGYELWQRLEQQTGTKLLHQTGALYLGAPDCELIHGSLSAARQFDLPHRVLSPTEVTAAFPAFQCREDWIGMFEPMAGYLQPEKCISAFTRSAIDQGAILRGHQRVIRWDSQGDHVVVQTDQQKYTAARLVVCGGAWSSAILSQVTVKLTPTRQVLVWVWPAHSELYQAGVMPCWAIDPNPAGQYRGIYYGFPMMEEPPGFKLAWHAPAAACDPDTVDREIHAADLQWVQGALEKHFIGGAGPVLSSTTCLYTNSPDGHFVIDRHPQHHNVFFAAGFSGHGFKFASVIGEVMADLALQGTTALPIDFLRLRRFTDTPGCA